MTLSRFINIEEKNAFNIFCEFLESLQNNFDSTLAHAHIIFEIFINDKIFNRLSFHLIGILS
jgi:hypothetical protein